MHYMDESFELALHLCGLADSEENYANTGKVDEILYKKYGIEDTDGFNSLIKDLLPLIEVGKGVSGVRYKGFSDGISWLMKTEI